jgi:outer membrane protein
MTRKALVVLAALAVGVVTSPLVAQTPARPTPARPTPAAQAPAPTRIAYLNSRAILNATPGYAAADTLFGRELAASRDEIQRMQQALDSAATDFETASVLLSPSVRQERQRQLIGQQQQLQQRQQELQGRMEQRQAELIDPIQQRVQAVIEGIRAELNIAMIFDVAAMQGAMVAADRTLDVTALVIQRLQAAPGR